VRTNHVVILIVAVAMGGVAALWSRYWLASHSHMAAGAAPIGSIVVAAKPLAFGVTVTADNIAEIPWATATLPEGAFATKDDLLKDGRRVVLSPLEPNEPVLRSKTTGPGQRGSLSSLLPDGKRAVTVRVDDVRGVAGFILPGDFVDVVLIGEDPASRAYVRSKDKMCLELGMHSVKHELPADTSEAALIALVQRLNADPRGSAFVFVRRRAEQ